MVDALFRRPAAFRSYVAASPSLWFPREQPRPPAGLARALGGLPPRDLVVLAGALEEPSGDSSHDPARAERQRRNRILGNARDLLATLDGLAPNLRASLVVVPEENHASMLPAAVGRAVRLAFASP